MRILAVPLDPPLEAEPYEDIDVWSEGWNLWLRNLGLSPRECELCRLLLDGMCYSDEFAKVLHIRPRTVKFHFNRLYLRFGITTGYKRVKLAVLLYRKRRRYQEFEDEVGCGSPRSQRRGISG